MSSTPLTIGDYRRLLKERRNNSLSDYKDWLFFNVLYCGFLFFLVISSFAGFFIGFN